MLLWGGEREPGPAAARRHGARVVIMHTPPRCDARGEGGRQEPVGPSQMPWAGGVRTTASIGRLRRLDARVAAL